MDKTGLREHIVCAVSGPGYGRVRGYICAEDHLSTCLNLLKVIYNLTCVQCLTHCWVSSGQRYLFHFAPSRTLGYSEVLCMGPCSSQPKSRQTEEEINTQSANHTQLDQNVFRPPGVISPHPLLKDQQGKE